MKLFEAKKINPIGKGKRLKEDGEGAATPANTAGLGAFSMGNNPMNPDDNTRGSGEHFGTSKEDEKLTEAKLSHSEMVKLFDPNNKKFFQMWDEAWNKAGSGFDGAAEFLAEVTGKTFAWNTTIIDKVLKEALSEGTFLDLDAPMRDALIDFITSKGRLKAPKYGLR